MVLLERALQEVLPHLTLSPAAMDTLIGYADGDARRLLSLLEQAGTAAGTARITSVDQEFLSDALSLNARRFDKGGDNFYDQISALHKSGASVQSGCRPVLVHPDARRRSGSEISDAQDHPHGLGGHWTRGSACTPGCERRGQCIRAVGFSRRRPCARASGPLSGRRSQRAMQGTSLSTRHVRLCAPTSPVTFRPTCGMRRQS